MPDGTHRIWLRIGRKHLVSMRHVHVVTATQQDSLVGFGENAVQRTAADAGR